MYFRNTIRLLCQMVWIQIVISIQIWVLTACKGYQKTTKDRRRQGRVKTPINGHYSSTIVSVWADAEGGGARDPNPPPPHCKTEKNIGFRNTGPVPLKNHKATKPAFNIGPSSALFKWRFTGGPKTAPSYSGILILSSTKETLSKLDPL